MKNYTLIISIEDVKSVILTDNPTKYLQEKRTRNKRLTVLFVTEGNFRGKIHKFGIKDFLLCIKNKDDFVLIGLNIMYAKILDL